MTESSKYRDITRHCFINAPFEQLQAEDFLDFFLRHRLQPEIGLEGNCLWDSSEKDFQSIADAIEKKGLRCTLHGPFSDLTPGGVEPHILDLSRDKLRRAFDLIELFQPLSIVCHIGYEAEKHAGNFQRWLDTSIATWTPLLEVAAAHTTMVMFENTYEKSPLAHKELFHALASPWLGFCLDTGHVTAFAKTDWKIWLDDLLPWLGQLHLHDNDGKGDDHIAIGSGVFDFPGLFAYLAGRQYSPIITLEPHSKEDLWDSLAALKPMNLFHDVPVR